MRLFKDDSQRAIDQVIDFFGQPSAGPDMCGELALELLCRDTDFEPPIEWQEPPAAMAR